VEQPNSAALLLVEDEDSLARLMESFLVRAGYKVDRFDSAQPALEMFKKNRSGWRAAILDLNLPDMRGIDLARHLLESDAEIRILMVSGLPQAAGQGGNPAGARIRYLQKPFRPVKLLEELEELLRD
jgi:two-component system sensor histidine kinase ChiS